MGKSPARRDGMTAAEDSDYRRRRLQYLKYCARRRVLPVETPKYVVRAFFGQLARLELGKRLEEGPIREAVEYVNSRLDCSDFAVAGLLRLVYKHADGHPIPGDLLSHIKNCLLGFKYWYDEPGQSQMCFWTENHQIIFHSDELLAGQLLEGEDFLNNGMDGKTHMAHAEPLILRWMEYRARFGFSEWLSNCYFEEDLMALANLYDFARNPTIRRYAKMLIDLLLLEIALHSHRGTFGSTHGRTYARMIIRQQEGTASTAKLLFGIGSYNDPNSLSAVSLATGRYRCPRVIYDIAREVPDQMLCQERNGLEVSDVGRYGISMDQASVPLFWGMGVYLHPKVITLSRQVSEDHHVRVRDIYSRVIERYRGQIAEHGRIPESANLDIDPTALTEVNIQTFRTPDYMLSSAQDYRRGRRGYQQHIWQATLDQRAVVFTNHPGALDEDSRPNYWVGNGWLPRVAQVRDVLVCIHRVPREDTLPFSHAYFPRPAFDRVIEKDGWIIGQRGRGYVALLSKNAHRWTEGGPYSGVEVVSDSPNNVWVCQMGSLAAFGPLSSFVNVLSEARIEWLDLGVAYDSPSVGRIEFGWDRPLLVSGEIVHLRDYPRLDSPYGQAPFGDAVITVRHRGREHVLDFGGLLGKPDV